MSDAEQKIIDEIKRRKQEYRDTLPFPGLTVEEAERFLWSPSEDALGLPIAYWVSKTEEPE